MQGDHGLVAVYEVWFSATSPAWTEAELGEMFADDFVAFGPSGSRSERPEFLAGKEGPPAGRLTSLRLSSGPGYVVARGLLTRDPPEGRRRFTSIWVERDAGWRCVTHHETEEDLS